jgi:hypothetical protein
VNNPCPVCGARILFGRWRHVIKCYQDWLKQHPEYVKTVLVPRGLTIHTVPLSVLQRIARDGEF